MRGIYSGSTRVALAPLVHPSVQFYVSNFHAALHIFNHARGTSRPWDELTVQEQARVRAIMAKIEAQERPCSPA